MHIVLETNSADVDGRLIRLTPAQAVVLKALNDNFGHVASVDNLYSALYGHRERTDKALRWHILELRRVLNPLGYAIVNRRGQGWVLKSQAA